MFNPRCRAPIISSCDSSSLVPLERHFEAVVYAILEQQQAEFAIILCEFKCERGGQAGLSSKQTERFVSARWL
jgi:hypothetical protein